MLEEGYGSDSAQTQNQQGDQNFIPQQQVLNPNAQPFIPQQQVLNPNAQPFIPQQQLLNPNAQPFIPQQQALNPSYPYIPDNTPVDPALINFIIGLPLSNAPYGVIRPWHMGWEVWAYEQNINGGYISHFNVCSGGGPEIHVYYNRNGQLQAVGLGQRPTGY